MINKAKELLKQKDKKQIFSNFVSLSALNAFSFLFPLITVPYLTRVLEPEKFGIVSFALVVMQYFIILTSFGFAFSATQQISINRDNIKKVSEIFSAVISVKLLLTLLSAAILAILFITTEQFRTDKMVFICSFGIVLGDALLPLWLFQGMEKMKFMTLVNFISKLLFTLLIFVFVKTQQDYLLVPLFTAAGYFAAGLISFVIAFSIFKLKIILPNIKTIKEQISASWAIFISTLSINLYRNANTLLLGLLTGNYAIVGIYSSAEKIIKGLQSLVSPVSDALFPYLSRRLAGGNDSENTKFIFKLGKYYFVALLPISLLLIFFAYPIVELVLGTKFLDAVADAKIMSFVILFGGINYFLGILGMMNMGYKKKFMFYVIITGIISITSLFVFIPLWQDKGASAVMLISEAILFVLLLSFFYRIHKRKTTQQNNAQN